MLLYTTMMLCGLVNTRGTWAHHGGGEDGGEVQKQAQGE